MPPAPAVAGWYVVADPGIGWHCPCREGTRMLMISRRLGERILIGNDIEITVTEVHRRGVRVAIKAPAGMSIVRGEIRDAIAEANLAAAAAPMETDALEGLVQPPPAP